MPAPFLLLIVLGSSCAGAPPVSQNSSSQGVIQWEPLRKWSGRGDQQLDSFPSNTGALRIEWETTRTPGATATGSLKIVMHSAISGRPLGAAFVDHSGEGKGTAYVSEEPRVFFMNVTSAGVEWTIAVSERVR